MKIGVYVRHLQKKPAPADMAKQLVDAGIKIASLKVAWQKSDGAITRPALMALHKYADAMRAQGLEIWAWGYPWAGQEKDFCRAFLQGAAATGASVWLPDPETSYKKYVIPARVLGNTLKLEAEDHNAELGFTSFGTPAFHPSMPWSEMIKWAAFVSPQYYKISAVGAHKGLDQWRRRGVTDLRPSVPAYGPNSGTKLVDYVQSMGVKTCLVWSYEQCDKDDWASIKKLA